MVGTKGIQRQPSRSAVAPFDSACLEPPSTGGAVEEKGDQEPAPVTEDISTLEDAIRSGEPMMVEQVLGRMTESKAIRELTTVQGVPHHRETPILRAARSGNVAMFTAVHQSMLTRLDNDQMVKALAARDKDETEIYMDKRDAQHTTLHRADGEEFLETDHYKMLLAMVAAEGGKERVFDEVVKLLGDKDPITELLGSEKEAVQLFTGAARGGSTPIFRRVMEAAVQRMKLHTSSRHGLQLLFGAARSGSIDMFETVLKMLDDRTCDIVQAKSSTDYTILMAAAGGGSVEIVSLVGEQLAAYPGKEVENMIRAINTKGYSCLLAAASSGRTQVVEKVLEIMNNYLAEDEVRRMIVTPCSLGDTVLMVAAMVPNGLFFREVVEILDAHVSRQEEMCNMLKANGDHNWNVLMEAAQLGCRSVFKAVMDVLREKLQAHETEESQPFLPDCSIR